MRARMSSVMLTALAAVILVVPALAQNNGKREAGEGKYADLTAIWWQWAMGQPASTDVSGNNTNPILDLTGEYAYGGQPNGIGPGNKFFFLAGTYGWPVERTVTVPKGKALFFPINNWETDNDNPPDSGAPTDATVAELRTIVASWVDAADRTALYARFDGVPVPIFRTKSPVFSYDLPSENSIYVWLASNFNWDVPQKTGTVRPAVADGYWAILPPPSKGTHLLVFGGNGQDNTYHLTVP